MTPRRPPASEIAATNATTPAVTHSASNGGVVASWADDRLGLAKANKLLPLRKVFPGHWSFMRGEIALWSFVTLLVTGVFVPT